jgi:hypothetical protein
MMYECLFSVVLLVRFLGPMAIRTPFFAKLKVRIGDWVTMDFKIRRR